jgi:replication-associated recombination protein RarA
MELEDILGQEHILAPQKPCACLLTGLAALSCLGPRGGGKQLWHVCGKKSDAESYSFAVTSGIKELKAAFAEQIL